MNSVLFLRIIGSDGAHTTQRSAAGHLPENVFLPGECAFYELWAPRVSHSAAFAAGHLPENGPLGGEQCKSKQCVLTESGLRTREHYQEQELEI